MLRSIAERYSKLLVEQGVITEDETEAQEYGLTALLVNIGNYGLLLLLGILCNCFIGTVIFLLAYSVLRAFLGGWHASKPWICTLCGIVMWSAVMVCYKWINISVMAQFIIFILLLITTICIIITKALNKKRRTGSLITLACITILFILLVLVHSSYSQLLGYSLMCNILMNLLPYEL